MDLPAHQRRACSVGHQILRGKKEEIESMKKVEVNLQVHRASACVQVVVMCYMYVVSSLYLDLVVHVL